MSSGTDILKKSSNSNGPESHGLKLVRSFVETMECWTKHHRYGVSLCHKIFDPKRDFSEFNKEFIVARLAYSVNEMKALLDNMKLISGQLRAFAKLDRSDEPLFNTWSRNQLATQVEGIVEMFMEETKLKIFVSENIAHCDDENLMEIFRSVWQFNTQLNEIKMELFKKEAQL